MNYMKNWVKKGSTNTEMYVEKGLGNDRERSETMGEK